MLPEPTSSQEPSSPGPGPGQGFLQWIEEIPMVTLTYLFPTLFPEKEPLPTSHPASVGSLLLDPEH